MLVLLQLGLEPSLNALAVKQVGEVVVSTRCPPHRSCDSAHLRVSLVAHQLPQHHRLIHGKLVSVRLSE